MRAPALTQRTAIDEKKSASNWQASQKLIDKAGFFSSEKNACTCSPAALTQRTSISEKKELKQLAGQSKTNQHRAFFAPRATKKLALAALPR
jgi:hypothetical protein